MANTIRQDLQTMFTAGVDAVSGFSATRNAVAQMADFQPDQIVAVGKAASGMCAGALDALAKPCPALLVTKYQHTDQVMHDHSQVTVMEAAHPVPDEQSLAAGQAALDTVAGMPSGSRLLLLVSGGTSALAESLPADMSLQQWQALTSEMLAAGYNIGQINTRRKETSLIKDGKLLAAFNGAEVRVLAISDVEGDDISVIGSGTGDTHRATATASVSLIGTNQVARDAVEAKAISMGFTVKMNRECMYQDVNQLAANLADELLDASPGVYIFGGEPTVELPENPGSGGRNQALALGLAKCIRGRHDIHVLVAGTDGSDGPTDAAGGIVDGKTVTDVAVARDALQRADAGTYLRDCGDIFITGPTNTNVMDLAIAVVS
ncbi:glycerate kinase type-2 family protein [Aliamphritea spongicola]|uniref:glycerate kinase type-2 family protein n=1 Tax=Aliamphritea spongicola TaxID=707589 RepID=UPI0030138FC7